MPKVVRRAFILAATGVALAYMAVVAVAEAAEAVLEDRPLDPWGD